MDKLIFLEGVHATAEYIRAMYEAYINQGFTEEQTMHLISIHVQMILSPPAVGVYGR
mgnify:CR=1 FL=1